MSVALVGCAKQAWFDGLKNRNRQECLKSPNHSETQKCLDQVDEIKIDQDIK